MFPAGNHQSCSVMILSETSLLTIIPWVSLRSTHGYKQIIHNGKIHLSLLPLCPYVSLPSENCKLRTDNSKLIRIFDYVLDTLAR